MFLVGPAGTSAPNEGEGGRTVNRIALLKNLAEVNIRGDDPSLNTVTLEQVVVKHSNCQLFEKYRSCWDKGNGCITASLNMCQMID